VDTAALRQVFLRIQFLLPILIPLNASYTSNTRPENLVESVVTRPGEGGTSRLSDRLWGPLTIGTRGSFPGVKAAGA
jgi:hypothetical protein